MPRTGEYNLLLALVCLPFLIGVVLLITYCNSPTLESIPDPNAGDSDATSFHSYAEADELEKAAIDFATLGLAVQLKVQLEEIDGSPDILDRLFPGEPQNAQVSHSGNSYRVRTDFTYRPTDLEASRGRGLVQQTVIVPVTYLGGDPDDLANWELGELEVEN
ncbi:hypothetical protein OT109_18680 [Phycisphaeraceae bacterium D3-23]